MKAMVEYHACPARVKVNEEISHVPRRGRRGTMIDDFLLGRKFIAHWLLAP